mmetsp:Transcript_28558/g.39302  ORF Transcript_28558/g.39302 Transcript_28558/m.39302 type:complete len:102 (+) Transcript_28558:118-423(+)
MCINKPNVCINKPTKIGLFESPNVSILLKSWITFYRFGLKDPLNRTLMKTGYRPWLDLADAAGTPWIFNSQFLRRSQEDGGGVVPSTEEPFEWQEHLEMWY